MIWGAHTASGLAPNSADLLFQGFIGMELVLIYQSHHLVTGPESHRLADQGKEERAQWHVSALQAGGHESDL